MSVVSRATLKSYFMTGDVPTQSQYQDLIDSTFSLAEDNTLNDGIKAVSINDPGTYVQYGDGSGGASIETVSQGGNVLVGSDGGLNLGGATGSQINISVDSDSVVLSSGVQIGSGNNLIVNAPSTVLNGGDTIIQTGDLKVQDGNLDVETSGKGLNVAEGANARQGIATLVAGSKVVSTTAVTANSRIFLTPQNSGGTSSSVRVSARTAGTSFTITSLLGTDTSIVAWEIYEPG